MRATYKHVSGPTTEKRVQEIEKLAATPKSDRVYTINFRPFPTAPKEQGFLDGKYPHYMGQSLRHMREVRSSQKLFTIINSQRKKNRDPFFVDDNERGQLVVIVKKAFDHFHETGSDKLLTEAQDKIGKKVISLFRLHIDQGRGVNGQMNRPFGTEKVEKYKYWISTPSYMWTSQPDKDFWKWSRSGLWAYRKYSYYKSTKAMYATGQLYYSIRYNKNRKK